MQEKNILYVYVTPSTSASPGLYNLKLQVEANGISKEILYNVQVGNCFDIEMFTTQARQTACPRNLVTYPFTIKNTGKFAEIVTLTVTGNLKESIALSDATLQMQPGESKTIQAYLTSPREADTYGFTVTATSSKTKKNLDVFLQVNPCYAYNVNVPDQTKINQCEHSVTQKEIEIENKGTVTNTYEIKTKGAAWAQVNKNKLTLAPGQKQNVLVFFAPDFRVKGSFLIEVNVEPELGSPAKTQFDVDVQICNQVNMSFDAAESSICKGKTSERKVQVVNLGEFEKEFGITKETPEWMTLEPLSFALKKGEKKDLRLKIMPTTEAEEKTYDIKLTVKAQDKSGEEAKASAKIKVLDEKECYAAALIADQDRVTVHYDSSLAIPVTVRNDGVEAGKYTLFVTGDAATFVRITPSALSVESGKSETAYAYISPSRETAVKSYSANIIAKQQNEIQVGVKTISIEVTDDKKKETPGWKANALKFPQETNSSWEKFKTKVKDFFSFDTVNTQASPVVNISNGTTKFGAAISQQEIIKQEIRQDSWKTIAWAAAQEYRYYILGGVIVLLVIIMLSRLNFFSRIGEMIEQDMEDDPKKEEKQEGVMPQKEELVQIEPMQSESSTSKELPSSAEMPSVKEAVAEKKEEPKKRVAKKTETKKKIIKKKK